MYIERNVTDNIDNEIIIQQFQNKILKKKIIEVNCKASFFGFFIIIIIIIIICFYFLLLSIYEFIFLLDFI